MGTSHSEQLNTLNNEIWAWCISRNLWISAAHIAGKSNVEADHESRQHQTATEWMLNKALLSQAFESLQFTPEIDLFASRLNCQFPQYVAYRPDPGAMAIDAFSITWTGVAGGIRDRVRVLCLGRMAERGNRGAARELERAARELGRSRITRCEVSV